MNVGIAVASVIKIAVGLGVIIAFNVGLNYFHSFSGFSKGGKSRGRES